MRLRFHQKLVALAGAVGARRELKHLLLQRYWGARKSFPLDFAGVKVDFSTEDFYSNFWFYLQSQIEDFVYEPTATRLLIERVRKCRAFADVGANLGYFTVVAAKVLEGSGRPVFAFEMDATLIPLIKRNLARNGLDHATVTNGYVSDTSGPPLEYTPHAYSFLGKASGIETDGLPLKLSAKGVQLDEYFRAAAVRPNFMKMDIDGAEMAALRGMRGLLEQPDFEMLLEIHPHHLPQFGSSAAEVLDFLSGFGFRAYLLADFRNTRDAELRLVESPNQITGRTGDMVLVTRSTI